MDAEQLTNATGSKFPCDYRELLSTVSDEQLVAYCEATKRLFAPTARQFDDGKNTEWLVRSYLALKFVLASTVLGTSAQYSKAKNVQIVLPYLNYYMLLNCCRAFLFTLPCIAWRGVTSVEMTHSKILKTTIDKLRRLDPNANERWGRILWAAKGQRDVFSYRFPATGLQIFGNSLVSVRDAISLARLLAELAQVNLACLESTVEKHKDGPFGLDETEDTWRLMQYEMSDGSLLDDDDYQRVGYFFRKHNKPRALIALATDGLVEDFFGAWCSEKDGEHYNPDLDWGLLLDVPRRLLK